MTLDTAEQGLHVTRSSPVYWAWRILLAAEALWLVRLFRTQLLVSLDRVEFRESLLFSQQCSPPSWSECSFPALSSSSSSASLSSSLRSSFSSWNKRKLVMQNEFYQRTFSKGLWSKYLHNIYKRMRYLLKITCFTAICNTMSIFLNTTSLYWVSLLLYHVKKISIFWV